MIATPIVVMDRKVVPMPVPLGRAPSRGVAFPACHGEGFGAARSGKDGRCVGRVEPRAPRRLPLSDPGDRFAVMERVETDAAAGALAARLNGSGRRKPIVVVTTPSGRADPWIDAVAIERELGDLAEVVLMPTGTFCLLYTSDAADE